MPAGFEPQIGPRPPAAGGGGFGATPRTGQQPWGGTVKAGSSLLTKLFTDLGALFSGPRPSIETDIKPNVVPPGAPDEEVPEVEFDVQIPDTGVSDSSVKVEAQSPVAWVVAGLVGLYLFKKL